MSLTAFMLVVGVVIGIAGAEPAQQSPAELTPAQRQALVDLIRNLQSLQAGPQSQSAITQWIAAESERTQAELKGLDEKSNLIKGQLEELEKQQKSLRDRLDALQLGRSLLAGMTPTSRPAAPTVAAAVPAQPPQPLVSPPVSDPNVAFFQQQVRPVLESQCFTCHGGKFKKSGMDLTTRDSLLHGGDSGPAIVAGNAESSLLYKLITHSQDPHMPAKADKLPDATIANIAKWINAGAPYDKPLTLTAPGKQADAADSKPPTTNHWAFKAPRRPAVPAVKDAARVRNPIDAFVLAKLESQGIAPSPEADRRTLIRRLSLDLLGLPPTSAEVDEFVKDQRPDAYERLVDRLLASPHYGEQWGRHWLDVARYADSDGYEADRVRPHAWRWRDWVIDAVNRDMPFDQFTIEQLAGDLLPNATLEQRVATGFHRNTLINKEGGVDQEEFRIRAAVDRVNTTGTVWLGLTVGCAECHSHKFDPISQREYYEMFAFFNTAQDVDIPAPLAKDVTGYTAARKKFDDEHKPLAAVLAAFDRQQLAGRQADWEKRALSERVTWTHLEPLLASSSAGATLTPQKDQSILAGGKNPAADSYVVVARTNLKGITALRLEALTDDSLPAQGPGRVGHGNYVLSEFKVSASAAGLPGDERPVVLQKAIADFSQGDRPWLVEHAIDGKPETGWAIAPQMGKNHTAIFETKDDIGVADETTLTFVLDQNYGYEHTLGRFRISATTAKRPVPLGDLPKEVVTVLQAAPDQRTAVQKNKLAEYYRSIDPERMKLQQAADDHAKTAPPVPQAQTLVENPQPPQTHIHVRGDFLRKGEEVHPATLAVMHPFKPQASRPNRLDLARWLVDPGNPLTARVTINRIWQHLFGRGLVPSPEDFGTRSEPPSHPELLDWLATEMIARGWSQKAMIKLIVESAAYRQSSRVRPELLERDPKNVLLARQTRFRIEAEDIRDLNLASAGLLNTAIGGPSIRPPLPPDVAALGYAGSVTWKETQGPERNRRGMYIFFQRTVPYPMLMTFDAPDSNVTCTRRERSNTPLQSLTLLNSSDFFECAQSLALHAIQNGKTPDERIRFIYRTALGRDPDAGELARLEQLKMQIDEMCRSDEAAAAKMVGEPMVKLVSGQLPDAAGWVTVARTVLNLDEFVTRE